MIGCGRIAINHIKAGDNSFNDMVLVVVCGLLPGAMELLKLFANSNRTCDEVVAFLREGMTKEQLAKNFTKRKGRKPGKRTKEI